MIRTTEPTRRALLSLSSLIFCLLLSPARPAFAAREKLELRYLPLPLPGAPSAVVAADVDADGHLDLAVVVAYTRWGQTEIEESITMDDVEGLVEVLTVIPSLVDRREIRVFPGRPDGGFGPGSMALPIDATVLTIEAGPPGLPVVAMTDDGLSALRMRLGASGPELSWERVIEERSVLAGTGAFLPDLDLVRDVDGDGREDVLFPTAEGISVYLAGSLTGNTGIRPGPASRVRFPLDDLQRPQAGPRVRLHPLPELRDVDGDRRPDLVLLHPAGGVRGFHVLRNLGSGRFGAPVAPLGVYRDPADEEKSTTGKPRPSWFGDLDGDGRAEYVTQEEKEIGDDVGLREGLRNAKRPRVTYRLHHSRADLSMEPTPYQQFEAEGYAFDDGDGSGDGSIRLPGGLQDLNGDGRQDLVLLTLDFSMLQAVKVMAVQRIGLGLDFHLWCQGPAGGFKQVRGTDLSGKFNLNLNNLKVGHVSAFAGDFDGDGLPEFVQMGRGRDVTIHRGRRDCAYNERPDLALRLEEEPRDLGLVQIRDLDGDKLSDLLVIQPRPPRRTDGRSGDQGVTQPVRLDLYLSGGGR